MKSYRAEACEPLSDEVKNNPNLKLFRTDYVIRELIENDNNVILQTTLMYQIVDISKLTPEEIELEFETVDVGTDLALENEISRYGFCANYTKEPEVIVAPKKPDSVGFWPAYQDINYYRKLDK